MFKPVYENYGKYYKQIVPPGRGAYSPWYALWQPVIRINLWLFCLYFPVKKKFWLDMDGFNPMNRSAKKQFKKYESP